MANEIAQPTWSSVIILFLGGVLGYFVKVISDLLVKYQERRNNLEKVITEKRLSAYEQVNSIVVSASVSMMLFQENPKSIHPAILYDLETFYEWHHKFVNTYIAVRHLIIHDLDHKLWLFNNYFHNLDRILNHILVMRDTPHMKEKDMETIKAHESAKLTRIGEVIYPDIKKLTLDILAETSKFFSTGIYETKYTPSTIANIEYSVPEFFTQLALFSRGQELLSIAQFFPNPETKA
jgi:hypothetical protein